MRLPNAASPRNWMLSFHSALLICGSCSSTSAFVPRPSGGPCLGFDAASGALPSLAHAECILGLAFPSPPAFRCSLCPRKGAAVSGGRLGPLHDDGVQRCPQQLHVMPIGPGDDKRERGATTVHQQAALGPFFFPDLSGCFPPPLVPAGLYPASHPSSATPTQSLPSRHILPARLANRTKNPSARHRWKCVWIALALPKTLGKAFHWQPVRNTYTMAAKRSRGAMHLRPPPGRRR